MDANAGTINAICMVRGERLRSGIDQVKSRVRPDHLSEKVCQAQASNSF